MQRKQRDWTEVGYLVRVLFEVHRGCTGRTNRWRIHSCRFLIVRRKKNWKTKSLTRKSKQAALFRHKADGIVETQSKWIFHTQTVQLQAKILFLQWVEFKVKEKYNQLAMIRHEDLITMRAKVPGKRITWTSWNWTPLQRWAGGSSSDSAGPTHDNDDKSAPLFRSGLKTVVLEF